MSMISFITVVYTLLIIRLMDNFPILVTLFPTIFEFTMFFVILYPILGCLSGYMHRKKQVWTDTLLPLKENLWAKETAKAWYMFFLTTGDKKVISKYEECLKILDVDPEQVRTEYESKEDSAELVS